MEDDGLLRVVEKLSSSEAQRRGREVQQVRLGRWRGRGSGFSHASHFSGWRQLESGQPPPVMSMISLGSDQLNA